MPNQDYFDALRAALSNERLEKYRWDQDETYAEAIGRYFFNIAVCEALYPCLQGVEVALRNSLNDVLTDRYGENWLTHTSIYLTARDQDAVVATEDRLDEDKDEWGHHDVVAGMSFGFWAGLLSKNYDASTHYHKGSFWPLLLKPAFPHMPKHLRQRATIEGRLTRIRRLRNRVFHHEPIWYYGDLADQHSDIIETISWICPDLSRTVSLFDRFAAVHSAGMEPHLEKVRAVLDPEQ